MDNHKATKYRMALIQMNSEFGNVKKNVTYAESKIREAKTNGANFISLPEAFNTGYHYKKVKEALILAEPLNGPTVTAFRSLAKELGVFLVIPLIENCLDGTYQNSAVLIGDQGEIIGKHAKCHFVGDESKYLVYGDNYDVFDTKYGKIGLLICYDICFPEPARILALKGAEVIVCPTACRNLSFYRDWTKNAFIARALDNALYTVGPCMTGEDHPDSPFTGSSLFVDPMGNVLTMAGIKDEVVLYRDIDLSLIGKVRMENTCLIDRRPESYTIICNM
jgi:predicted amidohydrolase